jgi:hypothetical protein
LRHDALVSRVSVTAALLTVLLIIALALLHEGHGVAWARVISQVALSLALVEVLRRQQLIARIWRGA